ncbi:hypothetical protein ELQ35_17975 [Peribacillus cavernae]|uniref:Uncharacterized protein n=1 Tax=Peribacillus cavernae TaxID=1674310 RepID=A0A433HE57_9BACI|nr:hypothetical protein [Peribacillus cavernae]MDQ0219928.1 hypothetical protein [Peribacillus cavernae]RUQ26593.1 hypothetical protein ELQ35_17975 [Peribacillus cavernae]
MLTFEEKLEIIESYPELQRKDVSLGRVNFHFEGSVYDKKIVVQHLHPNGNGFVYAGHLPRKASDKKGFINIREYSEEQLRKILQASISYLSAFSETGEEENADQEIEGTWVGPQKQELTVVNEDLLWNVYAGINLEECFESPVEATRYLMEEGFRKKSV